ncbi:hypothetical protein L1887_39373 [Cichorium endivia]|nr:hypothetical protein L1887_39373 [Cichorium endivia]
MYARVQVYDHWTSRCLYFENEIQYSYWEMLILLPIHFPLSLLQDLWYHILQRDETLTSSLCRDLRPNEIALDNSAMLYRNHIDFFLATTRGSRPRSSRISRLAISGGRTTV